MDIESAVCEDIKARQRKGIAKYGTTVAANPLSQRAWLTHAYEETLDLAIYLKKILSVDLSSDATQAREPLVKALEKIKDITAPFPGYGRPHEENELRIANQVIDAAEVARTALAGTEEKSIPA